MTFNAAAISSLYDKLISHALSLNIFETVNQHEPKSPPSNGLTASMWVESVTPASSMSGLAETSGVVTFTFRIYQNWLSKPEDAIDPNVMTATSLMLDALSNDLDLSSTVVAIDLLGMMGQPLAAKAGYVDLSKTMHRVMDITIPVIIDNMWTQGT